MSSVDPSFLFKKRFVADGLSAVHWAPTYQNTLNMIAGQPVSHNVVNIGAGDQIEISVKA